MIPGKNYIGVGCGAVIVNSGNQVLLLRRVKAPEAGKWTVPGGKVEFGETLQNALVREVKEEIGTDIGVISLLGVVDHILPDEQTHWVAPIFLAVIKEGSPVNNEPDKHYDMGWFAIDALPPETALVARQAVQFYQGFRRATRSGL
jgi:ADP-ribose pyrophosphatase